MSHSEGSPKASVHALNGAKRIGRDVYDQATRAYLEEPSERHVAKACGISRETAKRLINEGFRKLALPPISERARSIHRESAKAEDFDMIEEHRAVLRSARVYGRKLMESIEQAIPSPDSVSLADLERYAKLVSYLSGGPEQRVAVSTESRLIEKLTPEERAELIEHGRIAVRLRMDEAGELPS